MSNQDHQTEPIRSAFADDPDMAELVEMFVSEIPNRIGELEQHYETSDVKQIRVIAHQLKGAGGGYGFDELSDVAARLERQIDASPDDIDAIRAEFDDLVTLCRRVCI
ncbi:MAG: Hpt domain-containing protein [Planctomycetota bacterium]